MNTPLIELAIRPSGSNRVWRGARTFQADSQAPATSTSYSYCASTSAQLLVPYEYDVPEMVGMALVGLTTLARPPTARFDSLGYIIIPDAIPRHRVLELAGMVRAFHADADRPLRGVPFMDGVSYPDFHRADRLRVVFEALADNHKVRRELHRVLGGPFRFLGHNDVGINVSIGWHKDRLNGPYRQFESVDPWSKDSDGRPMSIVKALVYLQDHGNDDDALRLVPGSHRFASLEHRAHQEEILHPRAGDVILFDQRITHGGQLAAPHSALVKDATEDRSRILVSLGFGRHGTHSDDFELGTRLRQDMFNDRACGFDAYSACALGHVQRVLRSRGDAASLKAIERRAEEEVQKLWAPRPLPRFALTTGTGAHVRNSEWEYTDQLLIFRYMRPNDRALMLGGNIGGACVAMSAVAIDSTHIACVEPNGALLPRLDLNRARSNASFRIVHGVIVQRAQSEATFLTKCDGVDMGTCGRTHSPQPGSSAASSAASSVRVPHVTMQELEAPLCGTGGVGGPSAHRFTYVHLDCEGCACSFFRHLSQDRLRELRAVSLEVDGLETGGSQCNYERLFARLAAAGLERQPILASRTHAVFTRTRMQRPVPPLAVPLVRFGNCEGLCWAQSPTAPAVVPHSMSEAIRQDGQAAHPTIVVVGSSGGLSGSRLGQSIDGHHVIVRINEAPTAGYEQDVGSRTDVLLAHPEALRAVGHPALAERARSLILVRAQLNDGTAWPEQGVAPPCFIPPWDRNLSSMRQLAAPTRVQTLSLEWVGSTFFSWSGVTPSSGMVAVAFAVELAAAWESPPPLVVGFGGFGHSVCWHYFNCIDSDFHRLQMLQFHKLSAEMEILSGLSHAGKVVLSAVGPTNTPATDADAALADADAALADADAALADADAADLHGARFPWQPSRDGRREQLRFRRGREADRSLQQAPGHHPWPPAPRGDSRPPWSKERPRHHPTSN